MLGTRTSRPHPVRGAKSFRASRSMRTGRPRSQLEPGWVFARKRFHCKIGANGRPLEWPHQAPRRSFRRAPDL